VTSYATTSLSLYMELKVTNVERSICRYRCWQDASRVLCGRRGWELRVHLVCSPSSKLVYETTFEWHLARSHVGRIRAHGWSARFTMHYRAVIVFPSDRHERLPAPCAQAPMSVLLLAFHRCILSQPVRLQGGIDYSSCCMPPHR
jgi:hypothetical protein